MRQLPKYRQHNEFELFKSGCASSYDSAKIVKYSGFCLIDQKCCEETQGKQNERN